MASYYYLVASLPMLRFDEDPPISLESFLQMCEQNLGSKEYDLVRNLAEGNSEAIQHERPFLKAWHRFQTTMRKSLHEKRAKALMRVEETEQSSLDKDIQTEQVVKDALQADNPLDAELILMRYHWEFAEQLSQTQVFSLEVLFTYAIQLALLERKALFTPMEGNAEFRRLFSNLQSIIKSI
ncbi:MAG TPA: DUF2764 family protein [Sphaerochaetaceae bacterium]|nr:DUF2764 family protein [Sphaerochaetaceae bacterium]